MFRRWKHYDTRDIKTEYMMNTISLKCSCGAMTGTISNVSSRSGNRVVCYCDDCQAFANHIGAAATALDEFGGTEIFQTAPAQVKFETGSENLRCLRLTPKGLTRWYSECCNTPIANTISANVPFVGILRASMESDPGNIIGPVLKHVMGQYSKPGLPTEQYNKGFPLGITARMLRKFAVWKLMGKGKPNPFYADDSSPVSRPYIISEGAQA